MLDLQRDGRGRPAVDGWSWCAIRYAIRYAIRCAIDRAGTADSCSTAACVELELWPSQSSISRRPPLSSSSSHCADKYDDYNNENDGFKNDQCYFRTSGVLGQRDSSRLCADAISLRQYTLRDSKTLSSPPISATRPVHRADSFDGTEQNDLSRAAAINNIPPVAANPAQNNTFSARAKRPGFMDDAEADDLDGRIRGRDHRRQHLRRGTKDTTRVSRSNNITLGKKKEKKQILETPIEERISTLEARRAQLVTQKRPLEKKLEELRLRVQKQNESSETTDGRA
ncbi:hypothetical protein EKO27_g952 [Xylaria grammica]|uniref:Uncharacterized protein n=1 Tax=Xylaria grammica TaxID=363999 RepID=A0A439DIA8_9PEZI|nr:hypothetical protein EKO27_g952 [Xylaria grammica]